MFSSTLFARARSAYTVPTRLGSHHRSARAARSIRTSASLFSAQKGATRSNTQHTVDTYAKDDVDATPPPPNSSVYRLDATSDTVQKPNEVVSNLDSRANYADFKKPERKPGQEEEYLHSNSTYTTEGGPGLRYGGKEELGKEKGPETSGADEGPNQKSKGGRR
ncbi:hypothetical protein FA15DRAFT_669956 [Coprinopsis marcescibilis]|uniref:Uncharacterized protein n=1 Tax=Coprinopsis marcescibilis TaxID=230819 RepID=A0A5C3KTQ0_COPMA|nr:hypothetical protein FA15DRAFT_669956 [Coprinopsis marcescibilis]